LTQSFCVCICRVLDITVITIIQLDQFLSVFSTIFIGWRRTLTFDDIWAIREEDSSSKVMPAFERRWHREKTRHSVNVAVKYVNCH